MSQEPIDPVTGTPPEALLRAIRSLLRPLVRLLLHFQITYPYLSEMLKKIYVEVAEQEFQIPGKKQTDTRISLLTGVHRKDTRRLRGQPEKELFPVNVSLGTQLIAHWITDPELKGGDGKLLPLPLKGQDLNFESFVQRVCRQDMRARVVLDEWLRLGIVEIRDESVHLKQEAFIPENSLDDKAFFLGMNISDHLSAAAHNIMGLEPALFERCVYYEDLSAESIEQLEALAHEKGMESLKALNEKALDLKREAGSTGTYRFNSGTYFFKEQQPPED